jgi:N utilization substance protein A
VEGDRLVFVVPAGEMAAAIGQGGETVAEAERRLDKSIELVEDADTAEAFVASTLAPAAVNAVTISEQNDRVAYVEVPEADRGVAIGAEGANIETARRLAERHYDVDDVQLT